MKQQHKRLVAVLVTATALAGGQLAGAGAVAGAATGADRTNPGIDRLQSDATDGLTIERGADGAADFIGTTAGNRVVNPTVSKTMSVRDAARAHLARYGAALGLADGADLVASASDRSASGQDVVRFQQEIDSAPVIGGEVTVSLRGDRQLGSMLATISDARTLPAASVSQGAAETTAATAAARAADAVGLTTTAQGRAVWDPAVFGEAGTAQGVWQFEVGDGAAVRRLVLVDDTTGRVVLNLDQVEHLDRVVCDAANVTAGPVPCTSNFARIETGPESAVSDVNLAFVNAGYVAQAYQEMVGLDLTQSIGIDVGGVKKLASTVRYCEPGYTCPTADPYENAFWNGSQMYYGNGFAVADDVVGHEMTHGVIDQYSELFYWGQSGAMNESIADIMGEIIDHRNGTDDDSQWKLSEDLSIGAIRDMKDPTSMGDPDKMTSALWNADTATYGDGGGVHTNSGVGNKTAYLISQGTTALPGGTFNGQTATGIDGSDAGLTKTGKLYFDAITKLTSGSDYANLAAVLEQSCADFVTSGTGGFTTADCAQVAKAVLATELRTTPTNAPQPADAVRACPTGTTLRELFNSETGTPASKFASSAAGMWGYGVNEQTGSNATSGRDSWFGYDPSPDFGDPASAALTATAGIALPAGQKAYMSFQQWRLFEWYKGRASGPYIDGGTVEINGADTATLPWTNGPEQTLSAYSASYPNQWAGRKAFAGDSYGWTNSQVDLSSFAGQTVTPSFTTRGDTEYGLYGWFLDDITVYTCDVAPAPTTTPTTTPTTPVPTTTPPTTPPSTKATSTTKLTVKAGSSKVTIKAKVKARGAKVTGKVTFKVAGKKNVTTSVKVKKGKATLVLTGKQLAKLGAGKHTVKVTYKGSDSVARSKARASFNLR